MVYTASKMQKAAFPSDKGRVSALKRASRSGATAIISASIGLLSLPALIPVESIKPASSGQHAHKPHNSQKLHPEHLRHNGKRSSHNASHNGRGSQAKTMRQPELLARIARTDSKGIKSLQGMYDTSTNLWLGAKWWEDATILNTMITEMAIKHTTSYDGDVTETFSHYSNTKFSDGRYIGQHTDDMGWWLQTWIKAYDYFRQNEYLKMGEEIFGQMAKSWSGKCGGGIWWDAANRTYKNAISNELFLDGALKLYERTGNKYYLAWARREYGWFMHSGLINRQYLVNDGLNKKCKNNGEYTWTYTQGGLIQSLVDASHVFHRGYYLKLAQKVADANDRLNVDSHGILYEKGCEPSNSCSTNGTQFKGIYMQSLANLYFSNHNPADKAFILKNAGAIIAHDQENGKIGVHWDGPFANHNASTQSSGLDSLNAAILVKSVRH